MPTYQKKITEFSRGRRLLRLPRPLRDRADVSCDACGSSQPRTLYTLKDLESQRYFFVGDTCLKELARHGAVLRRYGRESGQQIYESEMLLRAQERDRESAYLKVDDTGVPAAPAGNLVLGQKWRSRSDAKCVSHLS